MTAKFNLLLTTPEHETAIEGLLNRTLGPGRFARMAERLREHNRPLEELCFVALDAQGGLAGSIAHWPINIGDTPALLLGPLVVASDLQGQGAGRALMTHALDVARQLEHRLVLLVGDAAYYGPVGFQPCAAPLACPGPVDPARLLVCPLVAGAADNLSGALMPARRC